MDVGRYKHNYEGINKKYTHQMLINRGRTTITLGANTSLMRILSFLVFLSWLRTLKKRSNDLEIVFIPLESKHLNSFN